MFDFIGSLFGTGPDYRGISIAVQNVEPTESILIAASIATQSQWYGPWDTPAGAQIVESFTGGTSNIGIAQTTITEMSNFGIDGNPMNTGDAIALMKYRVSSVQNACEACDATDRYIAAALAQNNDLNAKEMRSISRNKIYRIPGAGIDWGNYFNAHWGGSVPGDPFARMRQNITKLQYNTRFMLKVFTNNVEELRDNREWQFPENDDINWNYVKSLY